MKLLERTKYDFKHYIKSKPKLFSSIILRLTGTYVFVFLLELGFSVHPLFESLWLYVLFLTFVSLMIGFTTFREHAYRGYLQVKNKIMEDFKEELLANTEIKYTMNEVYNMLPSRHKSIFIEGMFEHCLLKETK